jgi:hypothetical protein
VIGTRGEQSLTIRSEVDVASFEFRVVKRLFHFARLAITQLNRLQ